MHNSRRYRALVGLASDRLARRVRTDFGATDSVVSLLADVEGERAQAAVILWAQGDIGRLREAVAVARQDWRDALVRSGLADDDWPQRLDAELGD